MKDETRQWLKYAEENLGGALPDAEPDREQCQHCLKIAEHVLQLVQQHLK